MSLLKSMVLLASAIAVSAEGYKRVCYYSNAAQYRPVQARLMPGKIDPYLCTHLIYAFARVDENSELNFTEYNDASMVKEFNDLKKTNPGLVTLLAVGGYNQGRTPISTTAREARLRSHFARTAIDFIQTWGFNGLSLDWQFTSGPGQTRRADRINLVKLLQELREAIETSKRKLLLVAAVPSDKDGIDSGYDVTGISQYLDFISLMTYDIHGPWENNAEHNSPLFPRQDELEHDRQKNVDWAASYWVDKGVPSDKLIVGLPTYGRSYTLARRNNDEIGAPTKRGGMMGPFTKENGFLAQYEVCEDVTAGKTHWVEDQKVPYLVKQDQWIGYDNEDSFKHKLKFIKDNNYGGAMVWSLDLDDFNKQCVDSRQAFPLVTLLKKELGEYMTENTPTNEDSYPSYETQRPPQTARPTPRTTTTTRQTQRPTQTPRPTQAPPQTERPTQRPSQPGASSSKQTPEDICKQNKFGYFEHPDSCEKFVICNFNSPVIRQCAGGTYWDQKIKNCNWKSAVDCKNKRAFSIDETDIEKAVLETLLRKLEKEMPDTDAGHEMEG